MLIIYPLLKKRENGDSAKTIKEIALLPPTSSSRKHLKTRNDDNYSDDGYYDHAQDLPE